ncbi:transporter [Halarcobacter ebronensis]|uniref:Transporter n=1 Tax=Halarcobacter ebronensis TaxID=1462615 RepID=A0A4Q0YCJ5_9BACT|nr:AEC family transporter [Halarcobacter ebronensis]RXJ66799.1 transporter [Halarcobacter ebronensis]
MEHILTALIPIFLLILTGFSFKKIDFPSTDFWKNADKLTYFILMPALLIFKLSTANLNNLEAFDFVVTGLLGIFAILVISIIINIKMKSSGAAFSSVVQGAIRFNTYVFLGLVSAILGDEGIALAALLITFAIPIINIICITVFAFYVNDTKATFIGMIKSIIKNPLIVACLIGGGINYFDFYMPIVAVKFLEILSATALPLGLLSIGFALDLNSVKEAKLELIISSALKLILMPLVMFFIGKLFSLDSSLMTILVIFAAMPTASSSFILARQLGGDTNLMASIITFETLFSLFTVSFILGFLQYLN